MPEVPENLFRYVFVGLVTAALYVLSGLALSKFLPGLVAVDIAFFITIAASYLMHHRVSFRSDASHFSAAPKFIVANIVGFALNNIIAWAGLGMHVNLVIVQIAAIGTVVTSNYIMYNLWAFKS